MVHFITAADKLTSLHPPALCEEPWLVKAELQVLQTQDGPDTAAQPPRLQLHQVQRDEVQQV